MAGVPVNTSLITGVGATGGLAVWGNDLFLLSGQGTVSEHHLRHARQLFFDHGPGNVQQLVISNGNLLIGSGTTVSEYDTSGNLLNASFGALPSSLDVDAMYVVVTPEPASWIMLAVGVASLAAFLRSKRRFSSAAAGDNSSS